MRVTRSQSAGNVHSTLKSAVPSKVAKPRTKPSTKGTNPTLESLLSDPIKTEDSLLETHDHGFTEGQKFDLLPKKKSSKPHIEQAFAHIITPPNLELPRSFITYHTPGFINAINHVLKIDPSLYPTIAHDNFEAFAKKDDLELSEPELINSYWYSLISSVISQQVSGSAAKAIKARFNDLFSGSPTPKAALVIPVDSLRSAGLLGMKVKYVVHISEVFSDPESRLTSAKFYKTSSPDELIAELTKLKGIGEWSANMFSVFTLKELDIFAWDDLGVARGVARYLQVRPRVLAEIKAGVHAIDELKIRLKRKAKFHSDKSKRDWTPIHDEYVKFLALKFEPFRTAFMLVMWRLSATNIDVLEKE